MSAKRSRALSRLENHNVSPVRTQNERSGNESQRKSKSAETCSRPRSEDNVPISHRHSKRSRERSPSKKRSRSRSRERSPSKKRSRSRSRSSRRKRSRTQSPRPGPSKDRHSVSSESGASSSARARVHRDREVTPEWARLHINEGIELINKRNKLLVLADAHGWEVAEAYNADPLADDSADEKKIRKAKKEGKILGDQKFKMLECLEQETGSHTKSGMKLRNEKLSCSLLAISRAHSLKKKKKNQFCFMCPHELSHAQGCS